MSDFTKGEYQPWSSIFAKADDLIGDENSAKAVIEVVKTHHDRFLIEATPFSSILTNP